MNDVTTSDAGRILVVEDEVLIAMDIEAELEAAGWTVVGPVGTVDRAIALAATPGLSGAVLDINLGHETSFPIAEALERAGVPYLFLSGGSEENLPAAFCNHRILSKPIRYDDLHAALAATIV